MESEPAGTTVPPARVALITGAGRGIGRHLAIGLAEAGLAVGLLGRSLHSLAELAVDLEQAGHTAVAAAADVTDLDSVVAAVGYLEDQLGGTDLLVNNAGVIESAEQPIWAADPDEWWRVVEIDLRGPFHLVRAVVPGMLERGGGRVVDVNSGSGTRDGAVYSAYRAAKAGLFRIGGAVHEAGFEKGLRSFEIAPGVVETDLTHSMPSHAGRTEWTDGADVVALVRAVAEGRLDAWSGRFLRVGTDTAEALSALEPRPKARTLGIRPYSHTDPLMA